MDLLGSVFDHLVLPTEIPGAQDVDVDAIAHDIIMRMIHATVTAIGISWDVPWEEAYRDLECSLTYCLELNRGQLDSNSLVQHFQRLHSGQMLILYLNEQNAGLLVRREKNADGDRIIFESMEASATSYGVLAAGHSLQWDFPGRSACISFNDFAEETFQQSLASFLEQASMESLYSLQASTQKRGVSVEEIRDTTDPALITQMLMSLLEAVGSNYQAPVLRKQVRDDVNFTHTNIPWRRLPFWLILRVAAQRQLCLALGAEQGQVAYKFLMAVLLAELLDDSAKCLSPHKVVCLRTKLARRMAKLEMNQEKIKLQSDALSDSWLAAVSTVVRNSIENANVEMETAWDSFKKSTTRRVPLLPHQAPPDSLKLTLPNSGGYLDDVLSTKPLRPPTLGPVTLPNPLDQSIQRSQRVTDYAFTLAALEERIEQPPSDLPNEKPSPRNRCVQLATQMEGMFKTLEYDMSPEQNSETVLALFTLWIELEKNAIAACKLIADHVPVFHPKLLDALQLPTKRGMERLHEIQEYLAGRHAISTYGSILESNNQDSIALRYVDASEHLRSLEHRIQEACDHAMDQKRREHGRMCNQYDDYTKGVAANRCICIRTLKKRIVDDDCKRCEYQRKRNSMKLMVQEALLPKTNPERDTIVFELAIPGWLSAYRDATWLILSRLAHPQKPKTKKPEVHLRECGPLKRFMQGKVNRLSMASKIKCFERTHYKFSKGRAPLTRVLLPFGATFKLYDSESDIWVEDLTSPLTLEHLCGIQTPRILLPILPRPHHPPTTVDGPSSYEIQANQAVVSTDIPVQVFSAYQKLLAGKRRRWPNLLVELSSSNLNLSEEDTVRLICQLASQAGPRLPNNPLRAVHQVFGDLEFTARLTDILETLLQSIRTNWREHNVMQLVVTLALRLHSLSEQSLGTTILTTARKYLLDWISKLREKIRGTKDSAEVQRYATYGLYAALLCRRTFAVLLSSQGGLNRDDLSAWIQASIAVQENILHDLSRLSDTLHGLLLRDAKMVYHLQSRIKIAMITNRHVVGTEILGDWSRQLPHADEACSSWAFLPEHQDRWIVATAPGPFPERLHFNYIEGHLLVNGKPRSKLPLDIADDDAVKFIFGDQHLLTYPSSRPGMSHRLAQGQAGHHIHFGLRNKRVIIHAIKYNHTSKTDETWEFIPQWRLSKPGSFDLPAELVWICGHWLNLNTGYLEIRRATPDKPEFWKTRPSDWIVDVHGRRAFRGRGGSQLVDPHSQIFTQIAKIFRDFEQPEKLTVFQPQSSTGKLTVELKHLDLRFAVNPAQLLQNQDAGTWYGLCSKIVMREINTQNRSIIVPLGDPKVRRNGLHVDVRIQGASHYSKFRIDRILGKLSSLYHAITSFCVPDPLTGRTGSSESFSILRSGDSQPCMPLSTIMNSIFEGFNKLVPRREFYPPDVKRIQKCDGYRQAIEAIKTKSNSLQVFNAESGFELREIGHLYHRGRDQRRIYDPFIDVEAGYHGAEAAQVYQISRVVVSHDILESFEIIGGFSTLDTHAPTSYAGPLISQIEDPINENWASKASLLFRLGLLAFHSGANMEAIHSLAAFYLVDEIKDLEPPMHERFVDFKSRGQPSLNDLENLISSKLPFDVFGAAVHDEDCRQEGRELARWIRQHWPIPAVDIPIDIPRPATNPLIDINSAWDKIKPEWERRYANMRLSRYITQVDKVLSAQRCVRDTTTLIPWIHREPDFMITQRPLSYRSIVQDWAAKRGPASEVVEKHLDGIIEKQPQNTTQQIPASNQPTELAELSKILRRFEQSNNNLRKQYAGDLRQSLAALQTTAQQLEPERLPFTPGLEMASEALRHAQSHVANVWAAIMAAFTADDGRSPWLKLGAIRPLSTTTELLKLLRSTDSFHFGSGMREAIVSYGVAITNVQHKMRIQRALLRRNYQALRDELRNVGHETWDPIEEPDWLLLEIDSDILIRTEQVAVARAIMDPTLGNGVLQLSMGKGKTSCIIPMVAAALADGRNLSRIVVPKALLMQTAQTMQSRLGGLVGREVIHIPFSRRTSTEKETLDLFADLHHETRRCHGVMLTCAEHVLSYKLYGWQKFVDSKGRTAAQMIRFQHWLDTHCRDVLDECDFTLSVKTQLTYPSGAEMPVDFHPYRWQIAQELLGLVSVNLRRLQRQHHMGIQVTSSREGEHFPAVQFLRTDTEDALHHIIIDNICSGHLTLLRPVYSLSGHKRSVIREVLCGKISDESLEHAAHLFANPNLARNVLLLVRGLLLHRLLVLCLNKRWNVQYGLHPDRDPIAVPYEAKGKPSEQAEYGHPDVSILFTCLSFYYAGLTQGQLIRGVQHILQSNDPAVQYECWISTCTELPLSLRRWNVINADDKGQMEELWRSLRWNRVAINYYLNHFVFPLHARQFEVKLQACSWDIPICPQTGTQLTRTTGFSGTNDNRLMLPLTISQRDLPELQHTSAEVLSYLLQKRNREFHIIANTRGNRLTEREFLRDLKAKGVTVLIDAGAYISEMDNEELAQTWLEVDPEAQAVVYFRNDNRAWVHYRSNTKEDAPLLATPFAEDLYGCNVFLDEGHTRGVDLRLPMDVRGAVTLALKLTKDHAVQAAMRLRQLKTTQSVCFYGPREVERNIKDFHGLGPYAKIDSSHVVSWLLEQTCRSVEDLRGLYVAQGVDFCHRTDAISHCKDVMTNGSERRKLLRVLRQPERKTLQELYGPAPKGALTDFDNDLISSQLRSYMDKLVLTGKDQQDRIQAGALEEVEQEREVEAQVEQVRQVEKRKIYDALEFPGLHADILVFARSGTLRASPSRPGFEHAFAFVGRTAVAKRFGVHGTSSKLFVSTEFTKTVEVAPESQESDNFLRPVEWILWSPKTESALIVIPEEAEHLLSYLRRREGQPRTHLIAYAAPVTKAMLHFNNLEFYSFPELPQGHTFPEQIRIELGILSGRLYVDQSEWKAVAEYVRGSEAGAADDPDKIAPDPAAFLLEWLTIRRKTVDVLHTPMGYICTGREMELEGSSDSADEE
ncbi:hypothetical protein F5X98DRAFT_389453 [Xylaria grammica]|nr:hypothetical protein F5X98DRAFT_389453 [Xylaria grammica]